MIKIVLGSAQLYETLVQRFPWLKYIIVLRLDSLIDVTNSTRICDLFRYTYVTEGLSKQTEVNRFDDHEKFLLPFLKQRSFFTVHDIGVSSGITALEWHRSLKRNHIRHAMYISDKYNKVQVETGAISRVFDPKGNLMLGYIGPFLASDKNKYFQGSRILFYLLKHDPRKTSKTTIVNLYDPSVVSALEDGILIEIDYDIFSSQIADHFSLVRCMNLLILEYFSHERIVLALKNLYNSLAPDGLLWVGKSVRGYSNASLFRKGRQGFTALGHLGGGADIKDLVLRFIPNDINSISLTSDRLNQEGFS